MPKIRHGPFPWPGVITIKTISWYRVILLKRSQEKWESKSKVKILGQSMRELRTQSHGSTQSQWNGDISTPLQFQLINSITTEGAPG